QYPKNWGRGGRTFDALTGGYPSIWWGSSRAPSFLKQGLNKDALLAILWRGQSYEQTPVDAAEVDRGPVQDPSGRRSGLVASWRCDSGREAGRSRNGRACNARRAAASLRPGNGPAASARDGVPQEAARSRRSKP